MLFEGEEVGYGLAGVFVVGEGVDDGDLRAGGHLGDGVVRVGAEDHDGHPALDVVRHVRERFALAERRLGLVDKDGVAAECIDGCLEGESGCGVMPSRRREPSGARRGRGGSLQDDF